MYRHTRPVTGLYTSIYIIAFFPNHHPNFQSIFFHRKIEKLHMKIWDTSRVFLYIRHHEPRIDSHITTLTRHQLLIKYDPPISVSNPTSSKPTRLGVDFHFFYNSYEIPNPTRSAIDPPEFDPAANYHHLQLSIPCKPRLYTATHIQTTENNPRTRP
jgi:hypothetical protein